MPDYLKAFQIQDEWLRWDDTAQAREVWTSTARNPNVWSINSLGKRPKGIDYIIDTRTMYRRPLIHGDCYYVDARITRNLHRLSKSVPLWPFTEDLIISRYGFALLGEPIFIAKAPWPLTLRELKIGGDEPDTRLVADTEVALDAIGWMPAVGGVQFVGYQKLSMIDLHNTAIVQKMKQMFPDKSVLAKMVAEDPNQPIRVKLNQEDLLAGRGKVIERPGYYPITHFSIKFNETWQDVVNDYEKLKREAHIERGEYEEYIDPETKFVYTLFNFMSDKRVVVRKHALPRSFRRHQSVAREVPLKDVNVILLRAEEEAGYRERNENPVEREWDWQWDVREHMRFNRRTGKKDIHVSAYRKGPPDKPLKPRGRDIYLVAR